VKRDYTSQDLANRRVTSPPSMIGSCGLTPDLAAPSRMAVRAAISKVIVLESTSSPE